MARPIEATPILVNQDAERLYREAEKKVTMTPTKKKQLEKYVSLYKKFISRLK